jgi:hypothetical protein
VGCGSGEGGEECDQQLGGVVVVLKCARTQGWALDLGLATAAARWRPSGGGVRVASAGDARERGELRWERQRATRRYM